MESQHKDIKVPPRWLAHCETGLQADARAAATPYSQEGRGVREGDLGTLCGGVCMSSFFSACPLSHTHFGCMSGMSWQLEAGLTGEQRQLFSSKQDSLT